MGRDKSSAGSRKGGPSREKGSSGDQGKPPVTQDEGPEQVRKRKREEEDVLREQKKWVMGMNERSFTCERQVNKASLGSHPIIGVIERHKLKFFFEKLGGYKPKVVREFYANMEVYIKGCRIESKVESKPVIVTPTTIARYLDYQRPKVEDITYPKDGWHRPDDVILQALTGDPTPFEGDRYRAGSLRELYRVINILVHHNFCPHFSDASPWKYEAELLYVFGSEDNVVDWAERIWTTMVEFRLESADKANIPFPIMVTKLCEDAGIMTNEASLPGRPKEISMATVKRSEAQSKPARAEIVASSKPTATSKGDRNEQWHNKNFNRQTLIMEEQERARKRDKKMMGVMKWIVGCLVEKGHKNPPVIEESDEENPGQGEV